MAHAIVVDEHGGSDRLHWREVPLPEPGPGEARVRVRLTGVNFADVLARRGGYDAGAPPPFVPGLDLVGTVEALGPGAEGLRIGQRVAAFAAGGSYGTHALVRAGLAYPLADAVPDEAAASLTALVTAVGALTLAARLAPGETVLVGAAAGGVGHLAVQVARALGAARVLGVAGGPQKAALVAALGAEPIDHTREDFAARALDLTGGAGADVVLDTVGGETLECALACLAPFGRLVAFGGSGGRAASVRTPLLHRTNRAVVGYSSGHLRRFRPAVVRGLAERALGLLASGEVRVHVGARFPLSDAALAHDLVESRASVGKVLLVPPSA